MEKGDAVQKSGTVFKAGILSFSAAAILLFFYKSALSHIPSGMLLLETASFLVSFLLLLLFAGGYRAQLSNKAMYETLTAVSLVSFIGTRVLFFFLFKSTPDVSVQQACALSQFAELGTVALCFSAAYIFQGSAISEEDESSPLVIYIVVIVLAAFFFNFITFIGVPRVVSNSEKAALLAKTNFIFFLFAQGMLLGAGIPAVVCALKRKVSAVQAFVLLAALYGATLCLFRVASNETLVDFVIIIKSFGLFFLFFSSTAGGCGGNISEEALNARMKEVLAEKDKELAEKTRELSQYTESLREKSIESQETSRIKSELLANMSHELRTPMNSIIGFTTRVIKKAEKEQTLPDRQLKNLKTVERNAFHLLSLINTILDVSKLEAGRMEVFTEEIILAPIVEEVIEMARSLIGSKDIKLSFACAEDISITSDRTKIKQVLVNLVGNAIKFTESGAISISVRPIETEEEKNMTVTRNGIICTVADTGVGIKQEDLKYVFDDYKQIDGSLTRKTGGTGLGLSLVKRFSQLLGGNVTVESEYQRGTKFNVFLPLDATGIEQEQTEEEKKIDTKQKLILSYEPDLAVKGHYEEYYRGREVRCIFADTIDNAFTLAKESYPRVIALDLLSPKKKGLNLIRKCRGTYYTKDIPYCVAGISEDGYSGYFLRIVDFMNKPVTKESISYMMNKVSRYSANPKDFYIVDNDEAALNLIHDHILHEGDYRVRMARDSEDLFALLQNNTPDFLLINIFMPEGEGFRILGELAVQKKWFGIPIVAIISQTIERMAALMLEKQIECVPQGGDVLSEDVFKRLEAVAEGNV